MGMCLGACVSAATKRKTESKALSAMTPNEHIYESIWA